MRLNKLLNFSTTLIVVMILPGLSCERLSYPKSSIGIVNNSNHTIEFYFALGGKGGIIYPDTILNSDLIPPFPSARAGETRYRDFGFSEEKIFDEIPSDTLSIYIFHPDTLLKYNWKTVIKDYNILKRYDLSFEDLEQLNWQVSYPPNDKMKGVKMYPK